MARRPAGLGERGLTRARESFESAPGSTTFKGRGPGGAANGRKTTHAPTPDSGTMGLGTGTTAYDRLEHDLGPWMETPSSSRVSRFRYDYQNQALQVKWRNNNNHGYIYEGVAYETFRQFARVASKGRFVNSGLPPTYRVMTDDEVGAPSNTQRQQVSRRRE